MFVFNTKKYLLDKSFIIFVILLVILPLFLENSFHYQIMILALFNAVTCIGLNMLIGYTGQISLGHGALMALGAYVFAILSTTYGFDSMLSIVISCLTLGILSYFISKPILKLEGHYLAMATLSVGIIIFIFLNNEDGLTGGTDGMSVGEFNIFGFTIDSDIQWYGIASFVLIFSIWALQNTINSPFGRVLRCIKDSPTSAKSVGIDVPYYKTYVFVMSVIIATISGSLYASYSGFLSPDEAGFMHSIELVVMVVLGGLGRIYGAVVGAFILTILPQLLTFFEDYEHLIYGLIIILIMTFMPKGIVSIFDKKNTSL